MQFLKSKLFRFGGFRSLFKCNKQRTFFLSGLVLLGNSIHFSRNIFFEEDPELAEKLKKLEGLKKLRRWQLCNSEEIQEGEMKEFVVGELNTKIIVIRCKKKLYALNATCPYDDETNLKDGIVFGNKLCCPIHGCAFNIETGVPEYAPARDCLPIYHVFEKEGKINLFLPEYPIKKIIPRLTPRDYTDLRKVIIVGGSAAAIGCAESLKENGYTGEIIIISKEAKLPYDKSLLTKKIKDLKFADAELRNYQWFNLNGITYILGREVSVIDNTHGEPYIMLEDGLKLEYDALLLATGVRYEKREFVGLKANTENFLFLKNFEDNQNLKKKLDKANKLTIVGCNIQSLELAATIRKEYPNIDVLVIDENEKTIVEERLGKPLFHSLVNLHRDNGVSFLFKVRINHLLGKKDNIEALALRDGRKIETDCVVSFPNNVIANTDIASETETLDNIQFDENARIQVDAKQRSDHKRIFAAGACSYSFYFSNGDHIPCDNWSLAYHQGFTAGYNILALNIPFHMTNFQYLKQYDKVLQYAGYAPLYDEEYTEGDVQNFKFITYYSLNNNVIAIAGTPDDKKSMLILREAMRLNLMPKFDAIKSKKITIDQLKEKIMKTNKSGCYRGIIASIDDYYFDRDVLWIKRDQTQDFRNAWEDGKVPTNEAPSLYTNE